MTFNPLLATGHTLSEKIFGVLLGFLLLALTVIGITLFLSWQLEGSAAAINEAGSVRMQTYRVAMLLARTVNEPQIAGTRASTEQQMQSIDTTFAQLRRGDPQRPLILPPTANIQTAFKQISTRWQQNLRPVAAAVLQQEGAAQLASWQSFQSQVDGFVGEVNALVHLIEQDSERRTFWMRSSQLLLIAMAVIGTVTLIYLMFLLIVEPVSRLHEGMQRMREKDFGVRLEATRSDEFGVLASGFNQMADRLQELYGNLEERVRIKTAALEDQNRELALLYGIAAFLQQPQPVEKLCDGFLSRLYDYFGADGGSVRVAETSRGNLHMVVHKGLSKKLVEAEHCLKIGDCLCGAAVAQKVAVVHDLRRMDEPFKLQCHREGFVTVSVFHIHAHQQHLGFFNLHFRKSKTFSKRDEALLETLGQLLGIAIENLRLATREREMAISEERNLVAQGLHDSIAQGLTFLNLQVQMLESSIQAGDLMEAGEIVPALRAGVQESYEDVRELLLNFRSRLVEGDLVGSLQITVEKFRRQTGIEVDFDADIDGAPFPREQQLQVLFIVQEALSNIRKHAAARHVDIRLEDRQDFVLSVHDDGVGFDAATLLQKSDSHVGLHIMRERAQRIHAALDVDSAPGAGTTIVLHLPQAERRAA